MHFLRPGSFEGLPKLLLLLRSSTFPSYANTGGKNALSFAPQKCVSGGVCLRGRRLRRLGHEAVAALRDARGGLGARAGARCFFFVLNMDASLIVRQSRKGLVRRQPRS